ncbi:MAG: folylpolyglutamate synthase/dihydrofolate synthase family protein [Longimicrobiales bacterium]
MGQVGTTKAGPDRLDPLTEDPLLRALFPALATGVEWGLERTEGALVSLGSPHRAFRSIHVGGTNGKGSVTTTLASVLRKQGRRVGCYTSPHLCSFLERIRVDGRPIDETRLLAYASEIREPVSTFGLTFFEAATVLAFHAFAREGVDVAAIEVGLGGRLDATNVVAPEVAIVTNIAMDHADFLGDSLPLIAREKAGIIKAGVPFVTGESDPALLDIFSGVARAAGAPMHVVSPDRLLDVVVAPAQTSFRMSTRAWGDLEVVTPLAGAHQAMNAAVAIEALEHVPADLRPDARMLLEGVRDVRHHGRNEMLTLDGRNWLFDVAHNPAGIASLVETLGRLELPRPRVALIGVLSDKDWRVMLPPLLERVDAAVLTVPPSAPADRRWDPGVAADALAAREIRAVPDFAEALAAAAARAGEGTVVVTGSVHTVGNAMRLLGVDPLR